MSEIVGYFQNFVAAESISSPLANKVTFSEAPNISLNKRRTTSSPKHLSGSVLLEKKHLILLILSLFGFLESVLNEGSISCSAKEFFALFKPRQ